jgi:hypothetical protein
MIKHLFFSIAFCLSATVNAQSNVTSSSKNVSNSSGSINYSVGQTFYQQQTGSNAVLSTGVQVPVEVLTLSIDEDISLRFSAKVFPNPTVKDVFIKIDDKLQSSEITYQLFSTNGKKITEEKTITGKSTKVSMKHLPISIYLLQIKSNNQVLKTFKIIKNQ